MRFVMMIAVLLPLPVLASDAGEIRWSELANRVVGETVAIPLAEGTTVQGEVLSVRNATLVLDVMKTGDARRYPRGPNVIERSAITEVRIAKHRGSGGRVLGTVLGLLLGFVGGAELSVHTASTELTGVSMFTAVASGATVAGYYMGRASDRHWLRLRIVEGSGE